MKNAIMLSIRPEWVAKKYVLYKHIFPNGKIYVGITSQKPENRFDNGNGYKTNPMKRAIKKYGWENVKHEIIATGLSKEEAEKKEVELISELGTTNIKKGYNLAKGGHSSNGCKHTKEAKEKMSRWHKGRKASEETKQKMSLWQMEHLENRRFGRLTAISPFHKNKRLWWHCICSCGRETNVRADHLKLGKIQSCGCLNREMSIERIRRVNNEKHIDKH